MDLSTVSLDDLLAEVASRHRAVLMVSERPGPVGEQSEFQCRGWGMTPVTALGMATFAQQFMGAQVLRMITGFGPGREACDESEA